MLTEDEIKEAAVKLFEAEKNRVQIPATTLKHPDMTMDEAYKIQKTWVDMKIAEGRRVKGYKIGLTSRAMQMAVNIDQPDYGVLLDDMFYDDGAEIEVAQFLDLRVEAELAFVLKEPLSGEEVSVIDVMNATDYVIPALELIAARTFRVDPETGYTRKVFDTIADNAANAAIIMGGRPMRPDALDMRWAGALLYRNGQIEETGIAAGVLNHPANGICWAARRFAPQGIGFEPGQVVLSGSFIRPVIASAGDIFHADYGPLGTITCRFV